MWTIDCICEIPLLNFFLQDTKHYSSSANGCGGGSADGLKWMMILHADELNGVFACGGISVWGLLMFCQAAISAVLSSFAWLCLGYLKPRGKHRWLGGFSHGMRASLRLPMTEPYWPVFTGFHDWVAVGFICFQNGKRCWKNFRQTKGNLLQISRGGGSVYRRDYFYCSEYQ